MRKGVRDPTQDPLKTGDIYNMPIESLRSPNPRQASSSSSSGKRGITDPSRDSLRTGEIYRIPIAALRSPNPISSSSSNNGSKKDDNGFITGNVMKRPVPMNTSVPAPRLVQPSVLTLSAPNISTTAKTNKPEPNNESTIIPSNFFNNLPSSVQQNGPKLLNEIDKKFEQLYQESPRPVMSVKDGKMEGVSGSDMSNTDVSQKDEDRALKRARIIAQNALLLKEYQEKQRQKEKDELPPASWKAEMGNSSVVNTEVIQSKDTNDCFSNDEDQSCEQNMEVNENTSDVSTDSLPKRTTRTSISKTTIGLIPSSSSSLSPPSEKVGKKEEEGNKGSRGSRKVGDKEDQEDRNDKDEKDRDKVKEGNHIDSISVSLKRTSTSATKGKKAQKKSPSSSPTKCCKSPAPAPFSHNKVDDMEVSSSRRSGRKIIPVLDFWANSRITQSGGGEVSLVDFGSSGLPEWASPKKAETSANKSKSKNSNNNSQLKAKKDTPSVLATPLHSNDGISVLETPYSSSSSPSPPSKVSNSSLKSAMSALSRLLEPKENKTKVSKKKSKKSTVKKSNSDSGRDMYIGRSVLKQFDEGEFKGKVERKRGSLYLIVYEDGDEEEMGKRELDKILTDIEEEKNIGKEVRAEWSQQVHFELLALKLAIIAVPPDSRNSWQLISKRVRTKSSKECHARWFEGLNQEGDSQARNNTNSNKKRTDELESKELANTQDALSELPGTSVGGNKAPKRRLKRDIAQELASSKTDDIFDIETQDKKIKRNEGTVNATNDEDDEQEEALFSAMIKKSVTRKDSDKSLNRVKRSHRLSSHDEDDVDDAKRSADEKMTSIQPASTKLVQELKKALQSKKSKSGPFNMKTYGASSQAAKQSVSRKVEVNKPTVLKASARGFVASSSMTSKGMMKSNAGPQLKKINKFGRRLVNVNNQGDCDAEDEDEDEGYDSDVYGGPVLDGNMDSDEEAF